MSNWDRYDFEAAQKERDAARRAERWQELVTTGRMIWRITTAVFGAWALLFAGCLVLGFNMPPWTAALALMFMAGTGAAIYAAWFFIDQYLDGGGYGYHQTVWASLWGPLAAVVAIYLVGGGFFLAATFSAAMDSW